VILYFTLRSAEKNGSVRSIRSLRTGEILAGTWRYMQTYAQKLLMLAKESENIQSGNAELERKG
jgi:hypothetical protein